MASNDVKNLNEYIEFSKRRTKLCRKIFWCNFALYAAGAISSIVADAILAARAIASHGGA